MPRNKLTKRTRLQLRLEAEREEHQRLAAVKLDAALNKIDELGKRSIQEVENQLQLLISRTQHQVLHMKWSDFLQLNLERFELYQFVSPAPPPPRRSHSNCSRSGRSRTSQQQQSSLLKRAQVQSVDRAVLNKAEMPPVTFLRWPKPGEVALSKGGSPLAVQSFPDRLANVHIPTKVGVLKLNPQKLLGVKREVLKQLDSATLNQIKTLNSNLHMIVDMATKLQPKN